MFLSSRFDSMPIASQLKLPFIARSSVLCFGNFQEGCLMKIRFALFFPSAGYRDLNQCRQIYTV